MKKEGGKTKGEEGEARRRTWNLPLRLSEPPTAIRLCTMSIFAVEYVYAADSVAGRDEYRPAHRAWLGEYADAGRLIASGPYTDGSGALLLFTAESEPALLQELAQDPFNTQGFIAGLRVTEWSPVTGMLAQYA